MLASCTAYNVGMQHVKMISYDNSTTTKVKRLYIILPAILAVNVLLLGVQGLRVLQEVLISFVLRLDLRADGGGALALKASGQGCREDGEAGGEQW